MASRNPRSESRGWRKAKAKQHGRSVQQKSIKKRDPRYVPGTRYIGIQSGHRRGALAGSSYNDYIITTHGAENRDDQKRNNTQGTIVYYSAHGEKFASGHEKSAQMLQTFIARGIKSHVKDLGEEIVQPGKRYNEMFFLPDTQTPLLFKSGIICAACKKDQPQRKGLWLVADIDQLQQLSLTQALELIKEHQNTYHTSASDADKYLIHLLTCRSHYDHDNTVTSIGDRTIRFRRDNNWNITITPSHNHNYKKRRVWELPGNYDFWRCNFCEGKRWPHNLEHNDMIYQCNKCGYILCSYCWKITKKGSHGKTRRNVNKQKLNPARRGKKARWHSRIPYKQRKGGRKTKKKRQGKRRRRTRRRR